MAQENKKQQLKKSFGGYMSVDRALALRQNWEAIKGMVRPSSITPKEVSGRLTTKATPKNK